MLLNCNRVMKVFWLEQGTQQPFKGTPIPTIMYKPIKKSGHFFSSQSDALSYSKREEVNCG